MRKFDWKAFLRGVSFAVVLLVAIFARASMAELLILILAFAAGSAGEENQSQLERIEQKPDALSALPR